MLPETNADGRPIVPMTDEQKYTFDTQGWFLVPNVLTSDEIAAVKDHIYRWAADANSVPDHERWYVGGAAQMLLDHPVVVGILNETLADKQVASAESYGFRCEGGFATIRKAGHDNWNPHGGGGYFNMMGNSHHYRFLPGKIHSGLTRIVWELNEVVAGEGGTALLSGSHKAAFPLLKEVRENRQHPLWSRYSCPPGSLLVFTEALTHTGDLWTNTERERCAVFQCYNGVASKFHGTNPPQKVIAAMPALRRSLFRDVWLWSGGENNNTKAPTENFV